MAITEVKSAAVALGTAFVVYFGDIAAVLVDLTIGSADLWVPFFVLASRIAPEIAPDLARIANQLLVVASVVLAGVYLTRIVRRNT